LLLLERAREHSRSSQVVLECLVGLALCCVAAFLMAGEMTGKFAWQELARR
jgi:hypothetical protein